MTESTAARPITVIATISSLEKLEQVTQELDSIGVDRSQISVLDDRDPLVDKPLENAALLPEHAASAQPKTHLMVGRASVAEAQTALIGLPAAIAAIIVFAIADQDQSIAYALVAAVIAFLLVAGACYFLARNLGQRRDRLYRNQMRHGGIMIFVTAKTAQEERKVKALLRRDSSYPIADMPLRAA